MNAHGMIKYKYLLCQCETEGQQSDFASPQSSHHFHRIVAEEISILATSPLNFLLCPQQKKQARVLST